MNKGSQPNKESGVSNEQGASAERLELTMTPQIRDDLSIINAKLLTK